MDPELQKLMEGPSYDSTGADDDDASLKDLRANRGDEVKATSEEPEPKVEEETKEPEPKVEEETKEPESKTEEPPKEEPKVDTKADDDKGHMIPKARYDSLRARMDQLEEQMAKGKAKEETAPDPLKENTEKLKALSGPLTAALADGDKVKIEELRQQERDLFDARAEIIAEKHATKATTESFDADKFGRAVTLLETSFPALNPEHETYNENLTNAVGELVEAFQARGHSRFEALRKAVATMEPQIRASLPPKVEEKTEDPEPEDKKGKVEEDRKAAAVKKAVDASKAQPANTSKQGQDADKKGIKNGTPSAANMTDEELDALPPETLRRMRGDFNVRART